MNFLSLGMFFSNLIGADDPTGTKSSMQKLAEDIFGYVSYILVPIMIVVGAAGIIYSIYLGVNLAKADSADKRQEAKSRMVNAIIGFVCIFVLVLLMWLFTKYAPDLFGWVDTTPTT